MSEPFMAEEYLARLEDADLARDLEDERIAEEAADMSDVDDLLADNPIATIMVVGDDHLDSNNYGQHLNYPKETLFYQEMLSKIAEIEQVTHYISTGDLVMKKDFSLDYRAEVDKLLTARKKLVESRGGEMIYIRGNHDVSLHSITEYDYYANRGVFIPAAKRPTLDFENSEGQIVLHLELKDWKDESPCNNIGLHNILITHGLFTADHVEGETMPNYGTAIDLTNKADWAGLEYILCGHIHTEHIQQLRVAGTMTTVHYLPCLARPQYIKKYEEGEQARREGSVDLIRVYDDGHIEVERYAVDFIENRLCFNIEKIYNDAAKLELSLASQSRREALKSMAEELQQYEAREVDPVAQIMALGNADELHKKIALSWFDEADEQLKKSNK